MIEGARDVDEFQGGLGRAACAKRFTDRDIILDRFELVPGLGTWQWIVLAEIEILQAAWQERACVAGERVE